MDISVDTAKILKNAALTDALAFARSMAALREAALGEIIKRLASLPPDKAIDVFKSLDTTEMLNTYSKLLEQIDNVNK